MSRGIAAGKPSRAELAEQGFTLIELLVALTIIGLLAVVAIGSLRQPAYLDRGKLRATLTLAAIDARTQAEASGEKRTVELTRGRLAGLVFRADPGFEATPSFYPDGSANGGVFLRGGQAVATVDWITGQIGDAR